ncbi:MAG: ADP-ribosylglycohydrolase family protein [Kordia sp.]|uniref:ADP-ribosylglycohydrolase family protein n=1 Tax=Kordia sp. TaxID=1965332 RepID=UPI003858578A
MKEIIIGIAIGDAFGAGVEFQDRDWIRENVDFTRFVSARNQIPVREEKKELFIKNYNDWDYTDDTEMTIGMLKALISQEPFTEDLLVKSWKEEYKKGEAEKGYGRNGHGSMSWYYSGEKTIDEIRDFQRNRNNPGNAPAMRSVPLGLITENLINEYASINAKATHPNINAVISSQLIARATEFLLKKNGDKNSIIAYCKDTVELNSEYEEYLNQVASLGNYDDLKEDDFAVLCGAQPIEAPYFLPGIKGVPSDSKFTTGSVLYVLKNSVSAMDALQKSIRLGGDVDSVASITTGIMAGLHGLDSIPKFMLDKVEGTQYLIEIAGEFEKRIQ